MRIQRRTFGKLAAGAAAGIATPAIAQNKPLTIGFTMNLTGPLAPNGKAALLAAQIWEGDINAKGGLLGRPVKLIYYDDQSNPSTVPGLYTKLLDVDKVDIIASSYATNMIAPAMPIVMQHDRTFFSLLGLAVNSEFHYKRYFSMTPTGGPQPKESFGGNSLPEKNSISGEPLNKIFGTNGEAKDGMVKFSFGRPAQMHGVKIDNTMGVNTWATFAGSDDNALVDGDFAVTEDELQAVLKSLVKQKIYIVAIHQHMTHEEPRIMFFHYWGRGRAKDLAQAVKGAFLVAGLLQVSSPLQ